MWPDASETQNLLHRVAQADASATDELWERYRPALRRMIGLRLDQAVARRVDASDVVQDVLIKASQRLARVSPQPGAAVSSLVASDRAGSRDRCSSAAPRVGQTHRGSRAGAVRRHGGSFDDRSSLDLAAQLRDSGLTPAAEALRRELQTRFHATLLRLDDDDREIILLRHFEQLSNSEAAQALGLSRGRRRHAAPSRIAAAANPAGGNAFFVWLRESL